MDETKIEEIVRNAVHEFLSENKELLNINELSIPLKDYQTKCNGHLWVLIEHLMKVCLYQEMYPQAVGTWRNEINAYAKEIVFGTVKQTSDKSKYAKRYVYEPYWGENFEEYDTNAPALFEDVIYENANNPAVNSRMFTDLSPEEAARINKERFRKFFDGIVECSKGNGNIIAVRKLTDDFIGK